MAGRLTRRHANPLQANTLDNPTEVIHSDLRGQTVVITGGAKGIGFSTAQAFVRQGARVALLDMDATALDLSLIHI